MTSLESITALSIMTLAPTSWPSSSGFSRRRVQQLAKNDWETSEIPTLQTPGQKFYANHPKDLEDQVLEVHESLDLGTVAIVSDPRVRDVLNINNRVHETFTRSSQSTST